MTKAINFIKWYDADIYIFPELFLSGYNFSSLNDVKSCAVDISNPESSLVFAKRSQIVDPKGNYLFQMHKSREYVKIVSIDPELAMNKKITQLNDIFEDRRMDTYFLN